MVKDQSQTNTKESAMKSVLLRICLGDCAKQIFGCTVSSVKMECKDCTQKNTCIHEDVKDFTHDFCDDCMSKILTQPDALREMYTKLKK